MSVRHHNAHTIAKFARVGVVEFDIAERDRTAWYFRDCRDLRRRALCQRLILRLRKHRTDFLPALRQKIEHPGGAEVAIAIVPDRERRKAEAIERVGGERLGFRAV